MHKRLTKEFAKRGRPVLAEHAIHEMEKDGRDSAFITPLHALYCDFKDEACGQECFNKSLYYTYRCIPALCFSRWLVLKGYAKFNFEELRESIDTALIRENIQQRKGE